MDFYMFIFCLLFGCEDILYKFKINLLLESLLGLNLILSLWINCFAVWDNGHSYKNNGVCHSFGFLRLNINLINLYLNLFINTKPLRLHGVALFNHKMASLPVIESRSSPWTQWTIHCFLSVRTHTCLYALLHCVTFVISGCFSLCHWIERYYWLSVTAAWRRFIPQMLFWTLIAADIFF